MKALSFDDISLVPRYNDIPSRNDVTTQVQFGDLTLAIPVFSANMDTITGSDMAREINFLGGFGFLHRFCSIEENIKMYSSVAAGSDGAVISLGVNEGLDRFAALYEVGARYFCIDVAHGHSKAVGNMIKALKQARSDVFVIAGNVCTDTGAEYLAECGADAIKIGVGPGSVCSTRVKTGFGVPQFSAILNCSRVNVFKIADGGIRDSGDAVKAFAAGADAVMLGGMLAGTDETPGDIITENFPLRDELNNSLGGSQRYKVFRGMASKEAQDDFMGTMPSWKAAEGITIKVYAKGPVRDVLSDFMGGIHSGMTYCGANNIRQIRERTRWVEVTPAGAAEGRPHGKDRL
jgi:IMP dehydrogenase